MRRLAIIALASFALAANVTPAGAFSFTPKGVHFTASDWVEINAPYALSCLMNVTGVTHKDGDAAITSVTFKEGAPDCATTIATGLPWRVAPMSAGTAKIYNVGFTGSYTGSCGPSTGVITVSAGGEWGLSMTLPKRCNLSVELDTSPPVSIAP